MRKNIFILTIGFIMATATPAHAETKLLMPWKFYSALAQCETGRNTDGKLQPQYDTLNYTGAFGIHKRTWRTYSNNTTAKNYTLHEQALVVDRIAFRGYTNRRGEYKYPVGPYGWSTIKRQNCMGLQNYICKSRHKLVVRWKRYC